MRVHFFTESDSFCRSEKGKKDSDKDYNNTKQSIVEIFNEIKINIFMNMIVFGSWETVCTQSTWAHLDYQKLTDDC